jgi:hypothetical protein
MTIRAEIERAIADEEHALAEIAALLDQHAELAAWPPSLRAAFELALVPAEASPAESVKAVTLRRHLFGSDVLPGVGPPAASSPADRRLAEHLRAGIPRCTRYRAGMHLLTRDHG